MNISYREEPFTTQRATLNFVSQNGHMLAIATLTIDVARSLERFQHSSNLMISDSLLFRLSKIRADLSFYHLVDFGYYTRKLKKKESLNIFDPLTWPLFSHGAPNRQPLRPEKINRFAPQRLLFHLLSSLFHLPKGNLLVDTKISQGKMVGTPLGW